MYLENTKKPILIIETAKIIPPKKLQPSNERPLISEFFVVEDGSEVVIGLEFDVGLEVGGVGLAVLVVLLAEVSVDLDVVCVVVLEDVLVVDVVIDGFDVEVVIFS